MRTWWIVWRLRRVDVSGLVGLVDRVATPSGDQHPPGAAPVGSIRLAGRLFAGFRHPLWESALLAAVLRRRGFPADLVIGYEPVPGAEGRRLVPWVEMDGAPVDRVAPPAAYCPELIRYPIGPVVCP